MENIINIRFDGDDDPRLVRGRELAASLISSHAFLEQQSGEPLDTSLLRDVISEFAQDGQPDWALILATLLGLQEQGAVLAHLASATSNVPVEVIIESAVRVHRRRD